MGTIDEHLTNIGLKCKKVRYLKINVRSVSFGFDDQIAIFKAIHSFTSLTHLSLWLPNDSSVNNKSEITVSHIKECKYLTHISIYGGINDTFFDSIHEYMPKLSVIEIDTSNELSDVAINSLAKLNDLKSLKLDMLFSSCLITGNSVYELVSNCVHLKWLTISHFRNISVEEFIKIANENSRISFKFSHCFFGNKDRKIFRIVNEAETFRDSWPKNIILSDCYNWHYN